MKNILAAPEDDDLRLVFADWLEDRGDEDRANLIRLQCEIARLAPWERGWQEATWRASSLLEQHGARWRREELPSIDGVEWTDFDRGFASTVRVRDVATLYEHEAAIRAAAPVSCVEMPSLVEPENGASVGSVPWLRTLRLTSEGAYSVAQGSSLLSIPSALEITGLQDSQDLEWLLDWMARRASPDVVDKENPGSAPLAHLKVEGNHTIGLPFVREFVEAGEAAAAAGISSKLVRLDLGTRFIDYDSGYFQDPTIGVAGANVLAEAQFLRKLEALNINRQRIGADGLSALVSVLPRLRSLEARAIECKAIDVLGNSKGAPFDRLDLSGNAISDAGAGILARAHRCAALKWLDLDTCEIGPDGLESLTSAPFWSTLRRLDLSRNPLGERGAQVLADAPAPGNLHALGLADADLDGEDTNAIDVLTGIPWLRDLSSLDLSRNTLGSFASLNRLANGSIRQLSLARTALRGSAVVDLPARWPHLWHLDLSENPLGDEGLVSFAAQSAGELHTLELRSCSLTSNGLALLAKRASYPRLYELKLAGNKFDAYAIAALLESSLMDHLRVLDLSACDLTEDAATVLASSPRISGLKVLNLRRNTLKESGLLELARSKHLRSVHDVGLTGDPWRYKEASRELLVERFGNWWYYDRDEELEDQEQDEAL